MFKHYLQPFLLTSFMLNFAPFNGFSSAFADQKGINLSVMSFNIRYGTAKDGKNSWSHRRNQVFNILSNSNADIICLQEALKFQVDEIMEKIKNYGVIGAGRDDGKDSGEHVSIFYNTKRFKIAKSGTFWFSDTPHLPATKHWGNRSPRICTWSSFIEKKSGKEFLIYNVHLDHRSNESRWKSVELLTNHIHKKARLPLNREVHNEGENYPSQNVDDLHQTPKKQSKHIPVLVMGDFNVGEKNGVIRYLKGELPLFGDKEKSINPVPLSDTFRSIHPKASGTTFHMFWGNRIGPKLDYIFASTGSTVIKSKINRNHVNGKFPSDHYPLTTTLLLK